MLLSPAQEDSGLVIGTTLSCPAPPGFCLRCPGVKSSPCPVKVSKVKQREALRESESCWPGRGLVPLALLEGRRLGRRGGGCDGQLCAHLLCIVFLGSHLVLSWGHCLQIRLCGGSLRASRVVAGGLSGYA